MHCSTLEIRRSRHAGREHTPPSGPRHSQRGETISATIKCQVTQNKPAARNDRHSTGLLAEETPSRASGRQEMCVPIDDEVRPKRHPLDFVDWNILVFLTVISLLSGVLLC